MIQYLPMSAIRLDVLQCRPSIPAILFPLGFIVLNGVLFTGLFGIDLSLHDGIVLHFISFLVLGLAFEVPELSLNCFCLWISRKRETFDRFYPHMERILGFRYILTHFIAPCSGITVMGSGLFLVHAGGYTFATGWLFWIMVTATFGLYKGMYQHNLFIRRLRAYVNAEDGEEKSEQLRRALRSPVDHALIFLEFPAYVFNYAVAYYKFPLANPWAGPIRQMDADCGMTVAAGWVILFGGALILPVLRGLVRKFSWTENLVRYP